MVCLGRVYKSRTKIHSMLRYLSMLVALEQTSEKRKEKVSQIPEQIKKDLINAIYPVLIPFEQQCMQIQAENYKLMEKIAEQIWKDFVEGLDTTI